jgi:glutamate racemase
MTSHGQLIGIFDSGVGGFSIVRAIHSLLPAQPIYYLADQAHVPYGSRSLEEVRLFSRDITKFLIAEGSEMIVVACNTASAGALHFLRQEFPQVPFVGMEPALKPATQSTQSGVVGVLATSATFQGELFASVVERFAKDVIVLKSTLPGLVSEIEKGNLQGEKTQRIIHDAIQPMLDAGADTLVLGCTHFPFVLPMIRKIAGPKVNVIDPSPAIAKRVKFLLMEKKAVVPVRSQGNLTIATTGNRKKLEDLLPVFLNEKMPVITLRWSGNQIIK